MVAPYKRLPFMRCPYLSERLNKGEAGIFAVARCYTVDRDSDKFCFYRLAKAHGLYGFAFGCVEYIKRNVRAASVRKRNGRKR